MPKPLNVVRAFGQLNFGCGCYATRGIRLNPSLPISQGEGLWTVLPCYDHSKERESVARVAESEWEHLTSEDQLGK